MQCPRIDLECARGACAAARLEQIDPQQVSGVRTVLDRLAKNRLAHSGRRTASKRACTAPFEASTVRTRLSIEVEQMLRRSPQVVHAHKREQLHPLQRQAAQPDLMDEAWHAIGAVRRSGLARRASGKRGWTWEVLKGRGLARRLRAGATSRARELSAGAARHESEPHREVRPEGRVNGRGGYCVDACPLRRDAYIGQRSPSFFLLSLFAYHGTRDVASYLPPPGTDSAPKASALATHEHIRALLPSTPASSKHAA